MKKIYLFIFSLLAVPVSAIESFFAIKPALTQGGSATTLQVLLPLKADDNQAWFVNARTNILGSTIGANVGIGYRKLLAPDTVVGFVPYLDLLDTDASPDQTEQSKIPMALTLNFHYLNPNINAQLNTYIPLNKGNIRFAGFDKYTQWLPGVEVRINKQLTAESNEITGGIILYGFNNMDNIILGGGLNISRTLTEYAKSEVELTCDQALNLRFSIGISFTLPSTNYSIPAQNSDLFSQLPERASYPFINVPIIK